MFQEMVEEKECSGDAEHNDASVESAHNGWNTHLDVKSDLCGRGYLSVV